MASKEDLITFMILQHLNDWDPYGLSPGRGAKGAPFDEYLQYASAASAFLLQQTSPIKSSVLADNIANQFAKAFGEPAQKFLENSNLLEISRDIMFHNQLLSGNLYHDDDEQF